VTTATNQVEFVVRAGNHAGASPGRHGGAKRPNTHGKPAKARENTYITHGQVSEMRKTWWLE
jgi:hypothetical protein